MNVLDFIFPKKCLDCGRSGKYICEFCLKKVPLYGRIGSNYSIFKYQRVIRKAIISLKYKFAFDLVDEIVGYLVTSLLSNKTLFSGKYCLVPIPLHKKRENWRGFNQAEIIGERLAKEMNWKFIPDLLIRNKNTVPQVGLKGSIRRSNLSGVFSVNPKYSSQFTVHDSPLLFDDVYTTGSTINEAKKALTEAGFLNIKSLTIAR